MSVHVKRKQTCADNKIIVDFSIIDSLTFSNNEVINVLGELALKNEREIKISFCQICSLLQDMERKEHWFSSVSEFLPCSQQLAYLNTGVMIFPGFQRTILCFCFSLMMPEMFLKYLGIYQKFLVVNDFSTINLQEYAGGISLIRETFPNLMRW
ncbi:hypothetical protein Avbf_05641 [Armadillidium vulgare]|nr:hypothetical protein Avbf_05641 [Armadillidium vulgare]